MGVKFLVKKTVTPDPGYIIPYSANVADESSGRLVTGWSEGISSPSQFTLSLWFNQSDDSYDSGTVYLLETYMVTFGYSYWVTLDTGAISVRDFRGFSKNYTKTTNQVFSKSSGWHHLCITVDTSNGTSDDRFILTLDGTRITSFAFDSGDYPFNYDETIFITEPVSAQATNTYIFNNQSNGAPLNGSIAELHAVYDSAPTATDFGEFNEGSLWVPKEYTGSHGDYGYYLDFSNNSDLGEDQSGNDIDFLSEGTITRSTDTPTS